MKVSNLTQLSAMGWLRNVNDEDLLISVPSIGDVSLRRAKGASVGVLSMSEPHLSQFERQYAVSNHMFQWALRDYLAQWLLEKYRTNEEKAVAHERKQLEEDFERDPITEKSTIGKVRKFQDRLRNLLLKERRGCQISGITEGRLLVASHIKAWSHCVAGARERLDPENVLLLACNWDALFDKYYISFSPITGKMIKANRVTDEVLLKFGVPGDWRDSVGIGVPSTKRAEYLQWHNEKMSELDRLSNNR